MSASLEEIKDYYERNPDNKDRTEYIKSIFNNDYTELTLEDGRTVGYKTFENVLHLWEGKYDSRTAQSFYDWAVIARHFEAMRLLGELSDSIKILSVDDERVMLYDYDMPLFNKEFSRTEFDRKVRENPMNEHLIVKEEPAEERNEKEPEPLVPAWEQKKKVKGFDLHPDVPMAERHTFNLRENEVETVGKKERFRRNIMAIQLLKKCQEENRFATPEEQIILSKYVGWGGLSEAFDENNSAWATEYLELSSVLTPEEYASARESTLTAFYTPPEVITAIYKAMEQMGFKEGNLLEPSCGIGNFIGMLPDAMQDSKIYGVELDTISAGIAQQLYQKTTIAAQGFEETNLPDSFFDGVVGNVPFGDFKVSDKRYDKHKFLIHDYFFAKSLDKLSQRNLSGRNLINSMTRRKKMML